MAFQTATSINSSIPLSSNRNAGLGIRRRHTYTTNTMIDGSLLKSSFLSPSLHLLLPRPLKQHKSLATYVAKISMRIASKQAYICRDCGYIYNDRTPFEKLPDKYFCPVCGAPKRRFKPYQTSISKNANQTDTRKARKAELQRDEAIGKALPIAIAVAVVALAGLYYYVNNLS